MNEYRSKSWLHSDAMQSLGFTKAQRHWRHPRSRYWVEFPAGHVAIGEETIHEFAEPRTSADVLRVFHPAECAMDRLSWYIHGADTQCLEQALRVAELHAVDLDRIERWARGEGPQGAERFREFERRLRRSRDQ